MGGVKPNVIGVKPNGVGAKPNVIGVEPNGWRQTQHGWCQTQWDWCGTQWMAPNPTLVVPNPMGLVPNPMGGVKPNVGGAKLNGVGAKPKRIGAKPNWIGAKPDGWCPTQHGRHQTQWSWCQTQWMVPDPTQTAPNPMDGAKPKEVDPKPNTDGTKPSGWRRTQRLGHRPAPGPSQPLPVGEGQRRRSPQVKELGAAIYNCSCLAKDLGKIFEAYWALGVPGASIPAPWPDAYSTSINAETPLETTLNDTAAAVFFSSSPPPLCAAGRTGDLEALLGVVDGAEAFVDVAVMSYVASTEFSRPERFWPAIDDGLRRAVVERGVRLRLLAGCWPHSRAAMFPFLKSLAAVADNRTGYGVEV
ncbi:hypothetical protein DV515_00019234, partial [Chloebia gouldiae]